MAAKKTTAPKKTAAKKTDRDAATLGKIEKLASGVLGQANRGNNPAVEIRTRTLSNVSFNTKKKIIELGDRTQSREFFNTAMVRKFMQTMLVASKCKTLIDERKTVSIRQMYYMSKHTLPHSSENTFEDQDESDPIIEDLEVGIDALREELHLFATRRGSVVGKLVIDDAGDRIDLSRMGRGGWSLPSICEPDVIKFLECKADFILFVEKDAVFTRLNEDGFWKKHNCILMTTGGQATRGARRLLQRMSEELKLPSYVLVDNDPWGLYIYSVLKQGSINLAYESMRMAVPGVRFLGMSSFDYAAYKLTPAVQIKLKKEDIARAEQMKAYPWFKDKKWQREIQALLENGFKMELDGFLTKSISFITDEYIPKKLRDRDYLQ
ncbi:MAG TPA: DNA topoisomerase IV subunit A [Polyangiaceae bacterium]|jgi:DNA topoisomerase-6 subunit A